MERNGQASCSRDKEPAHTNEVKCTAVIRVYDPEDPKSGDKLKKVANSIVEQIDALTKIANEFSTFAKMPNPSEERVELMSLITGVKEVFEGQSTITLESNAAEIFVVADKDQFVRVFNNLIKNAIQAIPSEREGKIEIRLQHENGKVKLPLRTMV